MADNVKIKPETGAGTVDVITYELPSGIHIPVYFMGGGTVYFDEAGVRRTINRGFSSAPLAGNNVLIAAQGAGIKIRLLAFWARTTNLIQVSYTFRSGGTAISASMTVAGGTVDEIVLPFAQFGWFETSANQALNLDASVASGIGCNFWWVQST